MTAIRLSQCAMMIVALAANAGCATNSAGVSPPTVAVWTEAPDSGLPYHKTFFYTGKLQSFVVPAHVTSLNVVALGAAGGGQTCSRSCYRDKDLFGRGGRIYAIIPVRPHEELYVFVGGKGSASSGGFNGGGNAGPGGDSYGGGGASDVRTRLRLADRIVVAAGGGGEATFAPATGGNGGGATGATGGSCHDTFTSCIGGGGGMGGTQSAGGAGGAGGYAYLSEGGQPGAAGTLGSGGNGGAGGCYSSYCGCYYANGCPGAGGGGGYYGGGGGGGAAAEFNTYSAPGGGGGGGSSWAEARAIGTRTWTGWHTATGNGLVVFSWR